MSEYKYSAEFACGSRAQLTMSLSGMDVEWMPHVPRLKGKKWRKFVAAYQHWRNECVADFAQRAGITIAVVDL
jgi:hypothetical protein